MSQSDQFNLGLSDKGRDLAILLSLTSLLRKVKLQQRQGLKITKADDVTWAYDCGCRITYFKSRDMQVLTFCPHNAGFIKMYFTN